MESLTAARNASQAGTEPSDAIRVVNSVLTQLDQLKRSGNEVLNLNPLSQHMTPEAIILCSSIQS